MELQFIWAINHLVNNVPTPPPENKCMSKVTGCPSPTIPCVDFRTKKLAEVLTSAQRNVSWARDTVNALRMSVNAKMLNGKVAPSTTDRFHNLLFMLKKGIEITHDPKSNPQVADLLRSWFGSLKAVFPQTSHISTEQAGQRAANLKVVAEKIRKSTQHLLNEGELDRLDLEALNNIANALERLGTATSKLYFAMSAKPGDPIQNLTLDGDLPVCGNSSNAKAKELPKPNVDLNTFGVGACRSDRGDALKVIGSSRTSPGNRTVPLGRSQGA